MTTWLLMTTVKAHGHEDWNFSKTVQTDGANPGEALDALDEDADFEPPERLQTDEGKAAVWYFKMEMVKQR